MLKSVAQRAVRVPALLALGLALGVGLLQPAPAQAATGQVTVTATNTAKFTMTLDAGSVAFGSSLTPDGDGTSGSVASFVDGTGAYYASNSGVGVAALNVTIKSNKAWSGNVKADENGANGASPDLTIAGGALRWKLGDVADLTGAAGATSFTAAAGGDTTVWNSASSCAAGATRAPGVCTYKFDYALRVRWTDAPGGFESVVTYTASQT